MKEAEIDIKDTKRPGSGAEVVAEPEIPNGQGGRGAERHGGRILSTAAGKRELSARLRIH